jgi:type IV secretory pathway TrbL component
VSPTAFVPLLLAAVVWTAFWAVNRSRRWFSVGEMIFWDVIILILIQLVWLRWF